MGKVSKAFSSEDSWDEQYRRYQAKLAAGYLIPVLRNWGVGLEGKKFLEVGCGDGGCAAEFHRSGCRATALDIDERLVSIASSLNEKEGLRIGTYTGDIRQPDCPGLNEGPFDIVLLRDVAEHIDDLEGALAILRRSLADDGVMFIVFPPYYSPFGAHQQILPRKKVGFVTYNKLPWIQMLPDPVFAALTRGDESSHREVARLRCIRLTIRGFERHVGEAGLKVLRRKFYLTRPTHGLRYGIPVVPASFLGRVPLLNELVVTACYYLVG